MSGPLPPYATVLGLTLEPDQAGAPVLVMPFAEDVLGRPGFLHGGAIAGLLEMAALAALRHALAGQDDVELRPVTTTVDYRRGGRNMPTRAAGIVARLGTRVANVEVVAWQDSRDRPIAAAQMNVLLARS